MTIRYPKDNILDKILALFGKERKVVFPEKLNELDEKFGPYSTISTKKQSSANVVYRFIE